MGVNESENISIMAEGTHLIHLACTTERKSRRKFLYNNIGNISNSPLCKRNKYYF